MIIWMLMFIIFFLRLYKINNKMRYKNTKQMQFKKKSQKNGKTIEKQYIKQK